MSGLGLVFSILLGAVLLYSLWHASQRKQALSPQDVLDELDPREREAITRELKAGRTLNAIARLRRATSLSPGAAKAAVELLDRESR
ncbi:MAG TPA: hypothetical protein VNV60_12525 [Holophagaceae bacterium]|nr:hypothetical protein [Holophagaceae bacterium]